MGTNAYMYEIPEGNGKRNGTTIIDDRYSIEEYDYQSMRAFNAYSKIHGRFVFRRQVSADPADKRISLEIFGN